MNEYRVARRSCEHGFTAEKEHIRLREPSSMKFVVKSGVACVYRLQASCIRVNESDQVRLKKKAED